MKVLKIEPGKHPEVTEIDNELHALQEAVGGYIECVYPWNDETVLVCNEEGKILNLPLNRKIYDGEIFRDVICGTFIIAGNAGEDLRSLTDDEIKKHKAELWEPDDFTKRKENATWQTPKQD